jgi:hypothetical protein
VRIKRAGIRLIIGMGSVVGFLGGWVLLAHAPKPVGEAPTTRVEIAAPAPEFLAPQPGDPFQGSQGLVPLPTFRNSPFTMTPRLRTHAS